MKINAENYSGKVPSSFEDIIAHCTALFTGVDQAVARSAVLDVFDCPIFWNTRCGRTLGANQAALIVHNMTIEEYSHLTYGELARARGIDESVYQKFADDDKQAVKKGLPILYIKDKPHMVPIGFFVPLSFRAPVYCPKTGEHLGGCGITINIAEQVLNLRRVISTEQWQASRMADAWHQQHQHIENTLALINDEPTNDCATLSQLRESLLAMRGQCRAQINTALIHGTLDEPTAFTPNELFRQLSGELSNTTSGTIRLKTDARNCHHQQFVWHYYPVFHQMLSLLIDNSVKHAKADTIECQWSPCQVGLPLTQSINCHALMYMDNGKGLSDCLQAYLMNSDSTASHPTGRAGLALLRRTVYGLLGGQIFCTATPAGYTAIHLVFPEIPSPLITAGEPARYALCE